MHTTASMHTDQAQCGDVACCCVSVDLDTLSGAEPPNCCLNVRLLIFSGGALSFW